MLTLINDKFRCLTVFFHTATVTTRPLLQDHFIQKEILFYRGGGNPAELVIISNGS